MHLLGQIRERIAMGDRTLVTALTKRLAEDLSNFFVENDLKCRWLHSELDAFERVDLLRELREGRCDVLVGVNLLREGLDLPEVSMVAILDADKEGFLRSTRSLIQTIGRAARHLTGRAILYADRITNSMRVAMDETERRRAKQVTYNLTHGITPIGIVKDVKDIIDGVAYARSGRHDATQLLAAEETAAYQALAPEALARLLSKLEKQMYTHARNLEFEQAAALRNKIQAIKSNNFGIQEATPSR